VAFLNVIRGGERGRRIPLDRERVILGRQKDCDVVLETPAVSRQHASIVREGDAYHIEDLQSRGGTLVNRHRVTRRTRLGDGDLIQIADWLLSFHTAAPVTPQRVSEARQRWERVAIELRAHRDRERRAWAGLDDATVGRCLAGEASPAQLQRLENALAQHPEARDVLDLVRGLLAEEGATAVEAAPRSVERELLFGALALERQLIDERQFADAWAAWSARRAQGLGELLTGMGWLAAADRGDIERLLARLLEKHGGDVPAALAASANEAMRRAVARAADPEAQRILAGPARPPALGRGQGPTEMPGGELP
jgi:predicted component of type VI protein secretion system